MSVAGFADKLFHFGSEISIDLIYNIFGKKGRGKI